MEPDPKREVGVIRDQIDLASARSIALDVAKRLLANQADCEDVSQQACVRLWAAMTRGLKIESVAGFLTRTVEFRVKHLLRAKASREKHEVVTAELPELATQMPAGQEACEVGDIRRQVRGLSEKLQGWLDDFLSGATDQELAARYGVKEVAIRKRRSRLRAAILALPGMSGIEKNPVTKSDLRRLGDVREQAPERRTPNIGEHREPDLCQHRSPFCGVFLLESA